MGRRRFRAIILLAAVFLASGFDRAVAQATPATQQTLDLTYDPTLDRTQALLDARHFKAAHDLVLPWLLAKPHAPERDRGLFLLATTYYQSGDRIRAFYHLDELLDNFPGSKLFQAALRLQYDIADAYLEGFKNKFLGMAILSADDEAIEMLFRIQERSPGSPLAEKALKRTADYYFNTSQFDLAGDAYESFIRTYPRSPDLPQIKLRQAFSSLARFRSPAFDATPLIDARSEFKAVLAQFPDLAAEANVPQWINHIDADLAHKAYITGDYYRRIGRPTGAAFMYRYVMQTYPNSADATRVGRALDTLPAWALQEPAPPRSNPEAAAQPTPDGPPAPNSAHRTPR